MACPSPPSHRSEQLQRTETQSTVSRGVPFSKRVESWHFDTSTAVSGLSGSDLPESRALHHDLDVPGELVALCERRVNVNGVLELIRAQVRDGIIGVAALGGPWWRARRAEDACSGGMRLRGRAQRCRRIVVSSRVACYQDV